MEETRTSGALTLARATEVQLSPIGPSHSVSDESLLKKQIRGCNVELMYIVQLPYSLQFMDRLKIIVLATVPCELECVKDHFPTRSNKLERFSRVKSSWTATEKSEMDRFVRMSTPWITEISPIAYAVGTPRGEHPPAVKPWPWSTDTFTMAVVIRSVDNNNTTVGHLYGKFGPLLLHFLTHGRENECGRRRRSPHIPCRRIEGSLLRNVSWEEVGSTSEKL